jgi:putative membrane protein
MIIGDENAAPKYPLISESEEKMSTLIGIVVYFLVAAVVIWIVSKLNLGLTVDGYVTAILAAVVIAVVGGVVYWLIGLFNISLGGGLCGAIINLIVAAAVLLLSGRFLKGLVVKGFGGAIIAAIAIGVVGGLLNWLLGLIGLA